jgi:hypothetical protein
MSLPFVCRHISQPVARHSEGGSYAVVETARRDVREVPEPIPLRPALRVHRVQVIVCNALVQRLDLMFEGLTAKGGRRGDVEWEAARVSISRIMKTVVMTDFTGTISPLCISFAAAATRVGVNRLRRPIYIRQSKIFHMLALRYLSKWLRT